MAVFVVAIITMLIVVAVIIYIVEAVIQLVETIIQLISIILGWEPDSQTIEYYEVHNIPLFSDKDIATSLTKTVLDSVRQNTNLTRALLFALTFAGHKGNLSKFMKFIEDGDYFEGFPTVESFILVIDYTELTAALFTLNGVPCTPEQSALNSLDNATWVKYWLQENKEYNVGTNTLGVDFRQITTTPVPPPATGYTIIPSANHFDINITDTLATEDDVLADERWQVDFGAINYNVTPDTYSVGVYNAPNVGSINRVLSYTVPTKPLQLHYISYYYRDSAPSRQYLFLYKVGTGVYVDLDTVESAINIDNAVLQTMPAIPLRIGNSNYTTFGATKAAQIEDICDIISVDAEGTIDRIMSDPNSNPGDIDNVYINFGVRMWDTSQVGLSYLFNMFENLYPSQGTTQGTYNNAGTGDDKPQNNIITETEDNKQIFQWSYITYEHFTVAEINADSGSTENGIYYSDLSRFDSNNLLLNRYYSSSGKGTYNVGYKADTLAEVQDFLDGNGVVNPGTTTAEAANWMQPTIRMGYNNTTPNLLESDGTASTLIHITPDMCYENNGSGVLKLVQQASEPTTVGQSITYYCCKPSGLDAYTVVAPIGALRVVDGDTSKFKFVKFNLGHKNDLMVPFIHTFIKDLSNPIVTKLLLKGCHASIYIAHYEVIQPEGMSIWLAVVMLIVIVVIIVLACYFGPEFGEIGVSIVAALLEYGVMHVVTQSLIKWVLWEIVKVLVVNYMVQIIITEIAGSNEELAMILSVVAAIGTTFAGSGEAFTGMDYADIFIRSVDNINLVVEVKRVRLEEELADLTELDEAEKAQKEEKLKEYRKTLEDYKDALKPKDYSYIDTRVVPGAVVNAEAFYSMQNGYYEYALTIPYGIEESINQKVESIPI